MKQNRDKREAGRQAARTIFWRTMILMALFGVCIFIPLGVKLYNLQITQHDKLQKEATDQQTRDVSVSAARGSIYDTNGNTLAVSATVYNVILSPKDINTVTDAQLDAYYGEGYSKGLTDEQKTAAAAPVIEARKELIISNMVSILGVDRADLEERCENLKSQYSLIAKRIESGPEAQVRSFIEENDLASCIYLTPDAKRYYPYSNLGSQVVGFVNADNEGVNGLEGKYEDMLSGVTGRVVTAKNGSGTDLLYYYSEYYDAEDGENLYLTLDTTIQSYCEQTLAEGVEAYDVQNGGWCIAMDPNTGAVLGMASSPGFDANDYATISDAVSLAKLEKTQAELAADTSLTEEQRQEQYDQAVSDARNNQWNNKCVTMTYEPGSTFKSCVLAAALEEGVVNENSSFYCAGYKQVDTWKIKCSSTSGHGSQTLAEAVGHSCNPAFIEIGQALGSDTFWDYLTAFGLTEKTGIDLSAESSPILQDQEGYNIVDLSTNSFGQNFNVTPIQLITAVSATINGGYLYTPHVLKYITDSDGNVTQYNNSNLVRQVVSEETSATVREMLEGVVSTYTGKNAYQAGYRIGGKTGTSQTVYDRQNRYVVSFIGFAPADDPQIIVLLAFDTPQKEFPDTTSMLGTCGLTISGGNMAAPLCGELIADICDYMGVAKQYSADEQQTADTTVPSVVGLDAASGQAAVEAQNLNARLVGEGDVITAQVPGAGVTLSGGGEVVLYLDSEPESVTMPDLSGYTQSSAEDVLSELGLNLKASGAVSSSDAQSDGQSVEAGAQVKVGSVVTVHFSEESQEDSDVAGSLD